MYFIVIACLVVLILVLAIKFKTSKSKIEEDGSFGRFDKEVKNNPDSYTNSGNFELVIEDTFTITGRGTIITGKIQSGTIQTGDTVFIKTQDGKSIKDEVTAIESFRRKRSTASAGENVGIILKNTGREKIKKGDKLVKEPS